MSIQTDDFAPSRRVVSAAPASPNEEAIERARIRVAQRLFRERGQGLDRMRRRDIDAQAGTDIGALLFDAIESKLA